MDKKDSIIKKEVDDKEDLEIQKIAYKNESNQILLYFLVFLFCVMLGTTISFINSYYRNKNEENKLLETIEVKSDKNQVLITNNGEINEQISEQSFKEDDDILIEKISTIELITNKNADKEGIIKFNVKYNIIKNDFLRNEYASNKSDILVRFSYSFDNEKWTYINNVISTSESTLSPLMGNYYDVSGIKSNLNIATNYELFSKPGEKIKMYWRSETTFKNNSKNKEIKEFAANFKIEYKDND